MYAVQKVAKLMADEGEIYGAVQTLASRLTGQGRVGQDTGEAGQGPPRARRAVGHTNGLNRIAILIPCHRVVNKNGALGGYGGGLWRKQALLEIERGERQYGPATPLKS